MTDSSKLTHWPDEASHAQHEGEDSEQSVQDAIKQVNGRPVSGPIRVNIYFEFAAAKISNAIDHSSFSPAGTFVENISDT